MMKRIGKFFLAALIVLLGLDLLLEPLVWRSIVKGLKRNPTL
jgi:hypothetical protein